MKYLALLVSLLFAAHIHAAEPPDIQRLIPWNSLGGRPHPDEAGLATADWTTVGRQSLAPRTVQTINRDWTFNYFPAEQLDLATVAPAADDSRWPVVSLPHTWATFETTREVHPFIAWPSERMSKYWWYGWGVYRKTFWLDPKAVAGRRAFVEFDGVMKYCRVWLNGREIGDHKGGYASFYFDLTPHLRPDTNVLAVAVSARRDDVFRTPPMTAGNFDVYGGICRDVRLVVKSPIHIPFQGSFQHEGGTFVTTPQVCAESAQVRVRTWVKNDDAQARAVTLRTTLLDPAGKLLTQEEVIADLAANDLHQFDQSRFVVTQPSLWSVETPTLYRIESEVRVAGAVVDRYASPLGFRWFEWNKVENRGYLNGKILHIHGTNRHQEFPWLGDAIPKWMHVRDLADIRFGQGHNFLRTAHYTQDSLVYDLADRYGILICEEVPDIKDIKFSKEVQRQQVVEMIRRDRNHPSIVMWSMGNETTHPADSAWAHAEDDTRILHLRHGNLKVAGRFITHTHENMDMENLLRCTVRGWTHRDVANFEPANGQHAGTEAWQHAQAMIEGASQRGRIDMPNGVMWIYADHGLDRQQYLNCPIQNIDPKGWTDLYRIPKYMYWLWQANYTVEPMVFVEPHYWQSRYIGQRHGFVVDSNCDRVELLVNGRSLGTQTPSARTFWSVTFSDVPVKRGELRVVCTKGAKTISRRVLMAGEPARLTLAASHTSLDAARDSILVLTMDVVDAAGTPVPEFNRDLHWEISGPATLLTPDTYKSNFKSNMAVNGTFYIVAPVCTLVRSTGEPGEITVTVKADGVAPASVKLIANPIAFRSSFVTEPALVPANRRPVATAPAQGAPVNGVPAKRGRHTTAKVALMKLVTQDLVLPRDKDRAFYETEVQKWFTQSDPAPMKRLAFDELVNALAEHLMANGGLLVADDFNHRAGQFNDVCVLDDAIVARKLPKDRAIGLVRSYARRLIRDGEPLSIAEEKRRIRTMSSEAKATSK